MKAEKRLENPLNCLLAEKVLFQGLKTNKDFEVNATAAKITLT